MLPRIVHIVRRFGLVGGMESYVWRLAHGLSERGCNVSVVCEQVMGEVSPDIEILQVDKAQNKRRWKSMLIFRERVDKLLKVRFKGEEVIFHSHERSLSHQVTTFHGPPIDSGMNLTWIKNLSPRIKAWRQMERDELLSPRVELVLPVSSQVRDALISHHPELIAKQIHLGWPGVNERVDQEVHDSYELGSVRFIFVGKEWKRKGLRRAIDIFWNIRITNPNSTFDVYGVDPSAVPMRMRERNGLRFMGWSSEIPWANYDLLIHPAESEPFGMVVAEARAYGLSVLMSDRVGAADLEFDDVRIVPLKAPLSEWVSALNTLLVLSARVGEVKWTWSNLVNLHCETVYPRLNLKKL